MHLHLEFSAFRFNSQHDHKFRFPFQQRQKLRSTAQILAEHELNIAVICHNEVNSAIHFLLLLAFVNINLNRRCLIAGKRA